MESSGKHIDIVQKLRNESLDIVCIVLVDVCWHISVGPIFTYQSNFMSPVL